MMLNVLTKNRIINQPQTQTQTQTTLDIIIWCNDPMLQVGVVDDSLEVQLAYSLGAVVKSRYS